MTNEWTVHDDMRRIREDIVNGRMIENPKQFADDMEFIITYFEGLEREREKAAVKDIKKRYTSYGERYDWGESSWHPVEEEVTRIPMKEADQVDPDEALKNEIDILETVIGDLRRENLRLQSELDSKKGP